MAVGVFDTVLVTDHELGETVAVGRHLDTEWLAAVRRRLHDDVAPEPLVPAGVLCCEPDDAGYTYAFERV